MFVSTGGRRYVLVCACTIHTLFQTASRWVQSRALETSLLFWNPRPKSWPKSQSFETSRNIRWGCPVGQIYGGVARLGISATNADSQWNPVYNVTHRIFVVETKRFVGSFVHVILTRQTCGQRSSRGAESKRLALGNYFSERICYMFQ